MTTPYNHSQQAIIDIDKFLDIVNGGTGLQRKHIASCLQHLNTIVNEHKTLTDKVAELEKLLESVEEPEDPGFPASPVPQTMKAQIQTTHG